VNATTIKYIAIIDFPHLIDYENPKNRVQLLDEKLEVFLMKSSESRSLWDKIQVDNLSREEIAKRRDEA
jgi:hypothetical protein